VNVDPQDNKLEVVWKGVIQQTIELILIEYSNTISIRGYITGRIKDQPLQVSYHMDLDLTWQLLSLEIINDSQPPLHLLRTESGEWLNNGKEEPSWNDCVYVDLNLTPLTNSLPINHLHLQTGESREIKVLYIDLLQDNLLQHRQRYTKMDDTHYKYESLESDFQCILEVDTHGIVRDYPGIWKRLV